MTTEAPRKPAFVRVTPRGGVQAPVEFRDAVELWARGHGRHADVVWVPAVRCWQVKLSPMPNDPRVGLYQKGKLDRSELWETVELLEPRTPQELRDDPGNRSPYKPIKLGDLGTDGLITLLEKGNTWSRRGEFASLQEAIVAARERQRKGQEELRRSLREEVRDLALAVRRRIFRIPFHRVGIDLTSPLEQQVPQGDNP